MVKLPSVSTHSHPKVAAEAAPEPTLGDLRFNTQPPEGGCPLPERPWQPAPPRFNTQPPEGGCLLKILHSTFCGVSTHSHPKVAARVVTLDRTITEFQHTATRRWLRRLEPEQAGDVGFQHTATRRWLQLATQDIAKALRVSTHSHPKVAALINTTAWRA